MDVEGRQPAVITNHHNWFGGIYTLYTLYICAACRLMDNIMERVEAKENEPSKRSMEGYKEEEKRASERVRKRRERQKEKASERTLCYGNFLETFE